MPGPALRLRSVGGRVAAGAGLVAGAYAIYAANAWVRYGRVARPGVDERDAVLDRFMPACDIVERHRIRVAAPAAVTLAAACEQELFEHPVVRLIVRAREVIMGATGAAPRLPHGLLAAAQSIGWGTLAEIPGREIVMGAVTRPWDADVTFTPLAPAAFASFNEPGWVKIAWTLAQTRLTMRIRSSARKRAPSPPTQPHARASAGIGRSSRLGSR